MRQTDIVVTTIFEPSWLQGYLDDLRAYGRERATTLRIVADRKTPRSVFEAAEAARRDGFDLDCPTLEEQSDYLRRLGLSESFIPWDTDNRRNIGFLRAWESGADVLISIDDDNYCLPETDFVGAHHSVGQPVGDDVDYAAGGDWFNICDRLRHGQGADIFPRGYPYAARGRDRRAAIDTAPASVREGMVAVNAGLWLEDPDVDAVTRLAVAPHVREAERRPLVLSPETWSPINTQNTALIRDAIPAYYYVRMGFPIQGMVIDRFGDILSGYFLQKCAKHLGHAVRVGEPVAAHRRSPHNLFKDLFHELAGMVVIEDLVPWLQELSLEGDDYLEAYAALADALASQADRFTGFVWDDGGRDFLKDTTHCMFTWLDTLRRIGGRA